MYDQCIALICPNPTDIAVVERALQAFFYQFTRLP